MVALVDMRSPEDRARLDAFASDLGARVDLVSAATGTVHLPDDVLERGRALVAAHDPDSSGKGASASGLAVPAADAGTASPGPAVPAAPSASPTIPPTPAAAGGAGSGLVAVAPGAGSGPAARDAGPAEAVRPSTTPADVTGERPGTAPVGAPEAVRVELGWPEGLPDGGRHGFTPAHRARLEAALPAMAARLAQALTADPGSGPEPAPAEALTAADAPGPPDRAGAAQALPRGGAPGWHDGAPAGAGVAEARPGSPAPAVPPADGLAPTGSAPEPDGAVGAAGVPGLPDRTPLAAGPRSVLVLGFEELMYAPLRLAGALDDVLGGAEVRYSTTTRSPVLAVDDPGYAIRTALTFPAHDAPADGPGPRYAYNVAPGTDPARRFDAVVAVVDSAADTPALHAPDGLLARLAPHTDRLLLAVVPSYVPTPPTVTAPVPERQAPSMHQPPPEPLRGPAFSSYAPDDVGWLLQDFSHVTLEAPTEEREEAIQSGGAHYAESLPVEYQPSEAYQELFRAALDTSAARIARAVGAVTETVLAERSPRPVLVSLARAGTPVGVLMRRWARHAHGLDLPHYAVSIVRGRGIDTAALRWLADHHDPADVVFVDGWTGKGAITRELSDALAPYPDFDPRIAVLADPGRCVDTYGTRDDFLVPSACLNSTVSGLISRTVLRSDLVGPDDFHGAKFYRELAGADLSGAFVDAITARFEEVADDVAAGVKELAAADRTPTWEGWRAVERISEEYGIHDVNLVKPGVGETTRVLLRRVPWKILAKRGAGADLDHVRLLAEQRGVPVEETDGLPYTCVGLIHPRYTRGATGADGKAVAAR
ncbi:cysteine protease StiP domain-containing protein [Streptomyces himastatinicus]|uniref:cysteine protease StiP domain-containing protein n=1 Tax=Streptomyces himastatinicus TaxID=998084 RepID=UPI00247A3FAA|nr:cysteine protease StiP domain-containing protein [Streptomyces himastatinicus]